MSTHEAVNSHDDAAGWSEQDPSDDDQVLSHADQADSGIDQALSQADMVAAARDQRASARDQRAADLDQEESDRARFRGLQAANYDRTRRIRSATAIERDITSHARAEVARMRDGTADRRDRDAEARDARADVRDELAAALDAELDRLETASRQDGRGLDGVLRAGRERAAAARERAAATRDQAAHDRARAREDRVRAAADRHRALEELAGEGLDHLTGVLRRGVGVAAIERDLERARRTGDALVVAFVDVDGLKVINDSCGHAAGDRLLAEVARALKAALRSYDLVVRYGGDEFFCVVSGLGVQDMTIRLDLVNRALADGPEQGSVSVGFAELRPDDSPDDLVARADADLYRLRREHRPRG